MANIFSSEESAAMFMYRKKSLIILISAFAMLWSIAAFALCGVSKTAYADSPHGDHTEYVGLTTVGGELSGGKYYVTENTKLENNLKIAANAEVTICLNGYILCGNGSGSVITVNSGATLTVCDCNGTLGDRKHFYTGTKQFTFTDAKGDFLASGASGNFIEGGVITGGAPEDDRNGRGVHIIGGTLNLTGGTIAGNYSATRNGGGVHVGSDISTKVCGKFNMTGGAVSGNYSPNNPGGGVYVGTDCTFTMSGGKIWKNSANQGGGVDNDGLFEMTGGEISENSGSFEFGGGVITGVSSTFRLLGGTITKNKGNYGGGVYVIIRNKDLKATMQIGGNPKVFDNQNDDICAPGDIPFLTVVEKITDGAVLKLNRNPAKEYNLTSPFTIDYTKIMADGAEKYSECFSLDGKPYYRAYPTESGELSFTQTWLLQLNLYKGEDDKYVTDTVNTTYQYSSEKTVLPTPSRTCYKFDGWFEKEDFSGSASTTIAAKTYGNKIYYAKWTENHSFDDWSVTQEATCTAAGKQQCVCTECGINEEKIIPAKGHTEVADKGVAATCTENGKTDGKHCSVCDTVIIVQTEIRALGHNLTHYYAQAATCTENGWKAYDVCTRCDYTTKEEIAATGHDFAAAWTTDGNNHWHVCNNGCGSKSDEAHHSGGTATCTAKAVCEICSREYGGFRHIEVTDKAVAPTCTQSGKTEGKHCSLCNVIIVAQTGISALGHDYSDDFIVDTAATCTAAGSQSKHCSRCDSKTDITGIAALGHNIESHYAQAATCTEKGWNNYDTCTRCDYTTYSEISAIGHNYGEWIVERQATADEEGEERRYCEHDKAHYESRIIPKISTASEKEPFNPLWLVLIIIMSLVIAGEVTYIVQKKVKERKAMENKK